MSKKLVVITLVLVAGLATGAFTYSHSQAQKRELKGLQQSGFRQQDIFEHLFRHYMFVKDKAREVERAGKDATSLRQLYKDEANLTDEEAETLDQVATECMNKVSDIESRAQQIIADARARVPGGRLKEGEKSPPPPAELQTLQEEREATVLQAREHLRAAFDGESFARFDAFVQQKIAGNMKKVPLDHHKPMLREKARP